MQSAQLACWMSTTSAVCLVALQDVIKQLQLNVRDPRAFIDQLNDAGG
jgi:hypothetical protein